MAKSNYLPRILFITGVCLCGCAGSDNLVVSCVLPVAREGESVKLKGESIERVVISCLLPVVCENQVHLKFCSPIDEQRAKNQEPGHAGFPSEQTSKNSQQERVIPEVKYPFLTTDNRKQITHKLVTRNPQQESVFPGVKSAFQTTDNRQQITHNGFQQLATKRTYDSEIGTKEWGLNKGKRVEEYLEYVNLKKGQPWCAAFICWVYGQAGVDNPRSGWSPNLFPGSKIIWSNAGNRPVESGAKVESRHPQSIRYARSARQITGNKQQTTPRTADIFGLFFPEKNRIAHAGFIDQWSDTWLITVEGNTNVSGSREGDGVYRKRRLVRSVYQVARYIGEL